MATLPVLSRFTPPQRLAIQHWIQTYLHYLEAINIYADILLSEQPSPIHTSKLSGHEYLWEILRDGGHPRACKDILRMTPDTFFQLRSELVEQGNLQCSRYIGVEEMMGIFLYIVGGSNSNRDTQDRFQRSAETVSKSFYCALSALRHIYKNWVKLPDTDSPTPNEIRSEPKYTQYFANCRGAMDGTHIPANPPASERSAYRNRKGFLSQNVLGIYDFNLQFVYVLAGWEGSAADSTILEDALRKGFTIPEGTYYLGDAGFALTPTCLTPYRGIRYHLKEWRTHIERDSVTNLYVFQMH